MNLFQTKTNLKSHSVVFEEACGSYGKPANSTRALFVILAPSGTVVRSLGIAGPRFHNEDQT